MACASSCWSLGWTNMCCEPQLLGFVSSCHSLCAKWQPKVFNISVAPFLQLRNEGAVSSGGVFAVFPEFPCDLLPVQAVPICPHHCTAPGWGWLQAECALCPALCQVKLHTTCLYLPKQEGKFSLETFA